MSRPPLRVGMTAVLYDSLDMPAIIVMGIFASISINEIDKKVRSAVAEAGMIRTPVRLVSGCVLTLSRDGVT